MNPIIAYLLIGVMAILVIYFTYQSYHAYQKNPSRWFHILLGQKMGEGLLRILG
jgi:hypothetical protein